MHYVRQPIAHQFRLSFFSHNKYMKKFEYILLFLLSLNALYNWIKTDDKDYSIYLEEYKRVAKEISLLNQKDKEKENEILNIKRAMVQKDSIILNADPHQLDSLFTDFFERVR